MAQATTGGSGASTSGGAYSSPGGYTNGIWLVSQGGQGAIVSSGNLPAQGSGFTYYWLGTTEQEASSRLGGALSALGVSTNYETNPNSFLSAIDDAFEGNVGTLPGAPSGILGAIQAANAGGTFVTGPLGGVGDAASGAAGEAGTGAAAEGAAGEAAAGTAATALTGTAALAALLTSGSFWLRVGEAIAGVVLIVMGLMSLSGRNATPVTVAAAAAKKIK